MKLRDLQDIELLIEYSKKYFREGAPKWVTKDDIEMVYLYYLWQKGRAATRAKLLPQIINLSPHISASFRNAPAKLSRGMKLTPQQMKKLQSGQPLKIQQTKGSSWLFPGGTHPETFTGGHGVVLSKKFRQDDVIVNFQAIDNVFEIPTERWTDENEVLIKENGIGPLLDPSKIDVVGIKFNRNEWDSGNIQRFKL